MSELSRVMERIKQTVIVNELVLAKVNNLQIK